MKQSRQIVKSGETLIHRYRTQLNFRAEASLYLSLGINLLYAVYKAGTGIYYRSAWFGMTAFYYLILSTVRFFLLRGVRSKGQNLLRSFQKYRFCGWMLLILTLPIAGMGFYTIFEGHTAVYPGHLIYAAATYTFYNFGAAIANLVRYRRLQNPIYSASKILAFATAIVSLFSLQTAMITAFGESGAYQRMMNLCTGLGVFVTAAVLALFMIRRAKRAIAELSRLAEQNRHL